MKAWAPIACLAAGFGLGLSIFSHFNWQVSQDYAPYISVAALAGVDTVCGGVRAGIEGRFQNDIFASGFVLNTLLAAGLAWFGDRMGLDLALVAVIALGSRIFLNLSLIRRYYLNKAAMARSRQQEESVIAPVPQPAALGQKPEVGGGI
jgi:small basic protein